MTDFATLEGGLSFRRFNPNTTQTEGGQMTIDFNDTSFWIEILDGDLVVRSGDTIVRVPISSVKRIIRDTEAVTA